MRSVAGYAIEGELGRGAMGVVYRGRDPAGRPVALKLLLHTGSRTARERFLREARLCAALDHPHVLRVHGAGEDQGRPYIVYELLPGARPLDARCAPTLRERLLLLRDAARGLGHAHARGIVHRDVKPQNLLVGRDGVVRVADFGIASGTDLERLTLSGALVGTPSHMAPEQVAGQRDALGPTTDVWALGVVLYELVCAELPFVARSLPELAGAVLHGPRPRLPAAEGIPPGLDEVLARCLDRRPERRFPDAVAFADALERVLAGAGEPRRPRRPLLVAGTLLLGVGVGGAAWFLAGGRAVRSAAATAPPPPADATVPAAERADARGRAQAGRPGTTADLPRPSPRPRLPFPQRIFAPYPLDGPLPGESSPWVRELRTRAAGGDARALALLAYCVGGGYGVAPSPDGKLHLLHDAAHRGHPQACTFLGVHALRGQFVEGGSLFEPRPNPAVAARWFRIGAAGGDPLSAWWLLRLIRRGEVAGTRGETEELAARIPPELEPPVPPYDFERPFPDEDEFLGYLRAAARGHNAGSMIDAANRLEAKGLRAVALRVLWAAALHEQIDAAYRVGLACRRGADLPRDLARAAFWLRRAARRGHRPAIRALLELLEASEAAPDPPQEAAALRRELEALSETRR